jgi:hypothetical protein
VGVVAGQQAEPLCLTGDDTDPLAVDVELESSWKVL